MKKGSSFPRLLVTRRRKDDLMSWPFAKGVSQCFRHKDTSAIYCIDTSYTGDREKTMEPNATECASTSLTLYFENFHNVDNIHHIYIVFFFFSYVINFKLLWTNFNHWLYFYSFYSFILLATSNIYIYFDVGWMIKYVKRFCVFFGKCFASFSDIILYYRTTESFVGLFTFF